jgi:hypothetical protein
MRKDRWVNLATFEPNNYLAIWLKRKLKLKGAKRETVPAVYSLQ